MKTVMNLTAIQLWLDEALIDISICDFYHLQSGTLRLHDAMQFLVNELARVQAEHPELAETPCEPRK